VTEAQITWGIISLLIAVVGYMLRSWAKGLKDEIEKKTDIKACDKAHNEIMLHSHTHGQHGSAGEVIPLGTPIKGAADEQ
jgi:hypothetical protein